MSCQAWICTFLVFFAFSLGCVSAQNGTKQIAQKTYKLGVNSSNFSPKDLSCLLELAAIDFCKNVTAEQFQADLTKEVTRIKGLAALGLLQKLTAFTDCLSKKASSSLEKVMIQIGLAVLNNAKTGKIAKSYITKQKKMLKNKKTCKQVVNKVFIYTAKNVNPNIVQAGVNAAKKKCTTAEWTCCITAAKDFANVNAYKV